MAARARWCALLFALSVLDVQHVCTSPDCPSSLFPVLQYALLNGQRT